MKNHVKKIRMQKGILQADLAKAIGISRQHLSDIENYKKQPTIKIAFDCAKILGEKVDDLFYYF